MSTYREDGIRCPFYQSHREVQRGREIRCEGLTESGYLTQVFRNGRQRNLHMKAFCEGRYERCEIYRAVCEAKYGEE